MKIKIYTKEELLEDIFRTEGVKADFASQSRMFTSLYSQVYSGKLKKKSEKQEILSRIIPLINGDLKTVIPKIDKQPSSKHKVTLYVHDEPLGAFMEGATVKYYKGYRNLLDALEDSENIDYPVVFVIDHEEKKVQILSKTVH